MSYYNLRDEVNKLQEQMDKLEKLVYKITNNTTSGGALLEGVNTNHLKIKAYILSHIFNLKLIGEKSAFNILNLS